MAATGLVDVSVMTSGTMPPSSSPLWLGPAGRERIGQWSKSEDALIGALVRALEEAEATADLDQKKVLARLREGLADVLSGEAGNVVAALVAKHIGIPCLQ